MLNGWVKFVTTQRDPKVGLPFEFRTPLFELQPAPGVVVLKTSAAETAVFIESGTMRLTERSGGTRGSEIVLKQGNFYQRKAAGKGQFGATLSPEFIAEMPRTFRDSLPTRSDRFIAGNIAAKPGPDFDYGEVEGWLKSEPAIRRPLVQRWRGKVRDEAFRAALVANVTSHPEWDPVLFPEKYLPKPPPKPPPKPIPEPPRPSAPTPEAGAVPGTASHTP